MNRKAELEKEIKEIDIKINERLRKGHTQYWRELRKEKQILKAELKGIVDTENRIKEEIEEYFLQDDMPNRLKDLNKRLFGGKDNE